MVLGRGVRFGFHSGRRWMWVGEACSFGELGSLKVVKV